MNQGWDRVLHVVGKVFSAVSRTLNVELDRKQAGSLASSLRARIESRWSYLLAKKAGTVEALPMDRTNFDYAACLIHFSQLEMKLIEGRGELRVLFRPSEGDDWFELSSALKGYTPSPMDDLSAFSNAIDQHWDALVEFSSAKLR